MAKLGWVVPMLQGREIKDAVNLGLVHQKAVAGSSPLGLLAAARGRQVFMVDVAAYAATLEIDEGELKIRICRSVFAGFGQRPQRQSACDGTLGAGWHTVGGHRRRLQHLCTQGATLQATPVCRMAKAGSLAGQIAAARDPGSCCEPLRNITIMP